MNDEEFSKALDISPLHSASVQLHELYKSLQDVGFTRKEALYMVTRVLVASTTTKD